MYTDTFHSYDAPDVREFSHFRISHSTHFAENHHHIKQKLPAKNRQLSCILSYIIHFNRVKTNNPPETPLPISSSENTPAFSRHVRRIRHNAAALPPSFAHAHRLPHRPKFVPITIVPIVLKHVPHRCPNTVDARLKLPAQIIAPIPTAFRRQT